MPKPLKYLLITLVWLLIWQLASTLLNNAILFCSPIDVGKAMAAAIPDARFWSTILFSLARIAAGFCGALLIGTLLAVVAWRFTVVGDFLEPLILCIKSIPIVCFIVLLLLWFGSPFISASAVFLVVFPAVYFAIIEGLRNRDCKLLEMLVAFRVPAWRRLLAFYWPTLLPFLTATSRVVVGMAWKSGVAAELIGLPAGSIGERIYQAKILLSSADLLAWTLVIVVSALLCEKLFLRLLQRSGDWLWLWALPSCATTTAEHDSNKTESRGVMPLQPLRVANINKSYALPDGRKAQLVISNFTATFMPDCCYLLNSPSGSGKTTLLMLLAGLIKPDASRSSHPSDETVIPKRKIAMVFQEARLFERRSAIDNLRLVVGRQHSIAQIRNFLTQLLPPESLEQPVSELSGGMRRRVERCRALLANSELLLLDEPFAGLDAESRNKALALLRNNLKNRTLIIASHDLQDAEQLNAQVVSLKSQYLAENQQITRP